MTHHRGDERGATLVEFAIALPLLLTLLFGIIEYGLVFAQQVEVRHAAREGARLAAVDFGADVDAATSRANLAAAVCDRLSLITLSGGADVDLTFNRLDTDGDGSIEVGEGLTVSISAPISTITGFLNWAIPNTQLESSVDSRVEQPLTWTDGTENC